MNVTVIGGGGINGIITAWKLLKQGHSIILFEKGEVIQQTSSASSKLLHVGSRYLENFEFRLIKDVLKECKWWIAQAPHLLQPLKLYIPIYKSNSHPVWMYKLCLWLYGLLVSKQKIVKSIAGIRSRIKSANNLNKATLEYAIQQNQNLMTVFGGNWTTTKQLSFQVIKEAEA
jgi:glycerol-3-phosphate dehydrogenase